jgi:hypothetical protein
MLIPDFKAGQPRRRLYRQTNFVPAQSPAIESRNGQRTEQAQQPYNPDKNNILLSNHLKSFLLTANRCFRNGIQI